MSGSDVRDFCPPWHRRQDSEDNQIRSLKSRINGVGGSRALVFHNVVPDERAQLIDAYAQHRRRLEFRIVSFISLRHALGAILMHAILVNAMHAAQSGGLLSGA